MKILILAGGGGTRLWPVSRQLLPKQFMSLKSDLSNGHSPSGSMLIETVRRCLGNELGVERTGIEDIYAITSAGLLCEVERDIASSGLALASGVIAEPCQRNTAPAIALAIRFIEENAGLADDEPIAILPADHAIEDAAIFRAHLKQAEVLAREGFIVTLGVTPTRPETGYGYIECCGDAPDLHASAPNWRPVKRFVEKPDFQTASRYLAEGRYLWNAGIFVLTPATLKNTLKTHAPLIYGLLENSYHDGFARFEQMPSISFDHAVMEHAEKIAVIPMATSWSDVGSWESLMAIQPQNENGNVLRAANAQMIESRQSMIWSDNDRLVAMVGMEDCMVIDTPDALLVARRGESQRVREIVASLQSRSAREAFSPACRQEVWGVFETLCAEESQTTLGVVRFKLNPMATLRLKAACANAGTCLNVLAGNGEWLAETNSFEETTTLLPGENLKLEAEATGRICAGANGLTFIWVGMPPVLINTRPVDASATIGAGVNAGKF